MFQTYKEVEAHIKCGVCEKTEILVGPSSKNIDVDQREKGWFISREIVLCPLCYANIKRTKEYSKEYYTSVIATCDICGDTQEYKSKSRGGFKLYYKDLGWVRLLQDCCPKDSCHFALHLEYHKRNQAIRNNTRTFQREALLNKPFN